MMRPLAARFFISLSSLWLVASAAAQQVSLPAPRLLTLMPMGGQVGTRVEVTVTGENAEEAGELLFSDPKITAQPKLGANGKAEPNKFVVTIAADAPAGVHDARLMTRLGVSSARAFSVGSLPEVVRVKPNTALENAQELTLNTVCNAVLTRRAVDYYSFQGVKGKRVAVDCAAAGVDSKLASVLIIADAQGRDLVVNRSGGFVEFTPTTDGKHFIKVHGLTFQGGPEYFYRLALLDASGSEPVARQAATRGVSSFSWAESGKPGVAVTAEVEPNNLQNQAQKITLPCEVAGKFFPAADVDTYEFAAKKSEVWWVEVVSERLGLPTDPFVLVQRVSQDGGKEKLTDVLELNDIPSPIKPSSNGYSYDGPPYEGGSSDVLGKLEIKEDGVYRLQVRDLFGGTRNDPRNAYRLIIRKAAPDFTLVAWAVHFELRNGDRAALSKPIALRNGATMALEVVAIRRDGFEGDIELGMDNLPPGVTAGGLKILAGRTRGLMLITAAENAPRSFSVAKMFGYAQVNGATVTRPCRLASQVWSVPDASQEIPNPRLLVDVPVSVGGSEVAGVTIAPAERKIWEAKAGEKLTIPLKLTWRGEFTGAIRLRSIGSGLESVKELELPLNAPASEVALDLAALKLLPGDYTLAFYGGAVEKYRSNPGAVKTATDAQKKADQEAAAAAATAKKLADEALAAPADKKAEADRLAKAAGEVQKVAEAAKVEAANRLKAATDAATPRDIADIVVTEPIHIVVKANPPK